MFTQKYYLKRQKNKSVAVVDQQENAKRENISREERRYKLYGDEPKMKDKQCASFATRHTLGRRQVFVSMV